MTGMLVSLPWTDIALRLALTVLAGVIIGYNRSEHGKAAGMCTTVLVCLAASVAMIQVNLLLPMAGKVSDSFITNDLMRFPLGILTGVGFIGGGAILRRDNIVTGVTTAATLWLVTVIGLCMGGGQVVLGLAATGLGLFALWGLKWIERQLKQEHRARFSIAVDNGETQENEIRQMIAASNLAIIGHSHVRDAVTGTTEFTFDVKQVKFGHDQAMPAPLKALGQSPRVKKICWDALR